MSTAATVHSETIVCGVVVAGQLAEPGSISGASPALVRDVAGHRSMGGHDSRAGAGARSLCAGSRLGGVLAVSKARDSRVLRGQQRQQVAARLAQRFGHDRVPIHDLAREVERRPSTVRRLLDEAGVHAEDTSCVGLNEAELAAMLAARYREGAPIEALSRDTGIDRRVVRKLLTEAGVALRARQPLPADQIDWVIEQYRAGVTLRGLAELSGCSYSTIRRTLQMAGVTLRAPGGRSAPTNDIT
ncbi:MAG: hypothetical protein LC808_23635 [Actinobacteria bacterium]|nr:hypothetical protein [Actinomycetota bacterium]